MKIKILQINQDENIFYVGKIKARDLINVATTRVRQPKNPEQYKNYLQEIDSITREKIDKDDIWYLKDMLD